MVLISVFISSMRQQHKTTCPQQRAAMLFIWRTVSRRLLSLQAKSVAPSAKAHHIATETPV